MFLKLDDCVKADDDKEEDDEEKVEAPGESVDAHLAVLLHPDLLQWVKVVRYLPDYNDNIFLC